MLIFHYFFSVIVCYDLDSEVFQRTIQFVKHSNSLRFFKRYLRNVLHILECSMLVPLCCNLSRYCVCGFVLFV